jgi:light-regulated signal transduction histidine kinase (bacteriophytochrome)
MGTLIDDLLSFSRMSRTELQRSRLHLETMVDELRHDAMKDAGDRSITWHIGALPEVHGDPAMIRLVLVNLIANAVKYTRPRQHATIEIGARESDDEIVVWVRDDGVGFDPAYAHKLFGVFQRLHGADEFEGTGIGLANVRRIIQRHGGRTWAEGEPGKGAAFFFSLPRSSEPVANIEEAA